MAEEVPPTVPETAPTVPEQNPGQGNINLDRVANPFSQVWWTSQTLSGVPDRVMGWLVSQGWRITDTSEDSSTKPSTYTYSLAKQEMQPEMVLLNLCNSYTTAANDARFTNEFRYNQIVDAWASMISSSETHFAAETTQQNVQIAAYSADLDSYMDELDALVTANDTTIDDAVAAATLLVTQGQTEQDAFELVVQPIIDALEDDYNAHAVAARGYLNDLGSTEEARIIEQFGASLSVQLSKLIDDGLYTSSVAADITARNTRDRDEQIQALNDRLSREQLEEQHRLYGEQVAMRNATIGGKDRVHALALEVLKYRASTTMQLAGTQTDYKSKAIVEMMNIAVARLDGLKMVWNENMKLMAYQLDERNKLLVGLYAFVERRDDIAPEWKDQAAMIANLADSGSSWSTP